MALIIPPLDFHLPDFNNILHYFEKNLPEPVIQPLPLKECPSGMKLWIVRGDLIHHQVSGNKWFKLKYNLLSAAQQDAVAVLSFGGAWSNHIHALAAAGKQLNIPTVGVIRGAWRTELTPMLEDAVAWGMRLIFVDNKAYQKRNDSQWAATQWRQWRRQLLELENKGESLNHPGSSKVSHVTMTDNRAATELSDPLPSSYVLPEKVMILPEGGSNAEGIKGVVEWAESIYREFSHPATFFLPVGSGGTIAGFASISSVHELIGVPVLKPARQFAQAISSLICGAGAANHPQQTQWQLANDYHWGGYARYPTELRNITERIEMDTGILLDPVYTAKTLYALQDMLSRGKLNNRDIVMIHTGGLQGRRGFEVE